jgi:hypothetical protein
VGTGRCRRKRQAKRRQTQMERHVHRPTNRDKQTERHMVPQVNSKTERERERVEKL